MSTLKNDESLRRHYGAIRTCLTRGKRYGRPHYYAIAAGHLLIVCKATGETARQASRRLGLDGWMMQMMRRADSPASRALPEINRPARACVRGAACTCRQIDMHPRCGNWRRGDPQEFDIQGPDALDIALALVNDWRGWRPGDPTNEPTK